MSANDLALAQGLRDTRATLAGWNREPWPVLRGWLAWSTIVAAGLLVAVYVVARLSPPDPSTVVLPGVNEAATMLNVGEVLFRNSLVLALHAMACVAGFIASSALPVTAAGYSGVWRRVHDLAGPLAIGFVICATTFSLATQAYILRLARAPRRDLRHRRDSSPRRDRERVRRGLRVAAPAPRAPGLNDARA